MLNCIYQQKIADQSQFMHNIHHQSKINKILRSSQLKNNLSTKQDQNDLQTCTTLDLPLRSKRERERIKNNRTRLQRKTWRYLSLECLTLSLDVLCLNPALLTMCITSRAIVSVLGRPIDRW